MKKKEPFPSQIKYRKNNPAVSFRLSIPDKKILDELITASGKPLSKWMADFLHNKTNQDLIRVAGGVKTRDSRIRELENQIQELKKLERFSVLCRRCGKPVNVDSRMKDWNSKIRPRLQRAFLNYHHETCPR